MSTNETVRLLILNDSRNEVERLISMLNNAGRATRAQHAESEEVLTKLLQEQTWDLLLAEEGCTQVSPADALRQIKRLNKDVPMILISEKAAEDGLDAHQAVIEGLKLGAADVVPLDQDQHLLLVMQRELENRQHRQQRRRADQKLKEAERRSQQLLDSSRDAIAFVQDGMYLYANQSFAELFGYEDRDDIECMPVIDMVDEHDQQRVKQFLKDFTFKGEEAESSQLVFTAHTQHDTTVDVCVTVANAVYDEEACIEFMISSQQADSELLQAELQKIKEQDPVTGLFNRIYLVERLEKEVSRAINNGAVATALYIGIDKFMEHVQPSMGVAGTDLALADLARLLQQHTRSGETLARFGDDSFMLLIPDQNADQALERADAICKAVEEHIIDVDGKTIQTTVTIGVAVLNETSSSAEGVLDQALKAAESLRQDSPSQGNGAKLYDPVVSPEEKAEADLTRLLLHALDHNRFQLLFQPIISLRGAEDELYEVLLRLVDDQGNQLSPPAFMDLAAQLGVVSKIDRWVILQTIKTLSEHRAKGHNTRVVVNLHRDSVCDESLVPWLGVAFKAANLTPRALVFQAHEADVTNHLNAAKALFQGLAKLGSQSAVSHFGCSLNPFKTLAHAPADYVKIHGSFTQDIQRSNEGAETLSNLIKQLLEANKITIVPFVEQASVLSTLWQTGVHYIQGHYLQEPTTSMNFDFNMEG